MQLDIAPLRRVGLRLLLEELEQFVMDAVAQVLPGHPATDACPAMNEAQAAFLREAGIDLAD